MGRYRLTTASKIIMIILVLALAGGGIFAGVKTGFIKTSSKNQNEVMEMEVNKVKDRVENNQTDMNVSNDSDELSNNTINMSIDEWVGYVPIVKANGDFTTQIESIYAKHGINLNLHVINDATQSSNALIKGELDAAGYTINRLAFLSDKFSNSGVDVVMPYITNYSNGGDGIIAKSSIQSIEDLVGARVGVPQFSESHAMLVWFVNQSNLTNEEKTQIIDNLILFETADEAAKAFFAGKIDVAGTWQPYLSQAEDMTDSHILFSTANSTKLIMSGIVFRKDFAESNPELVSKFIDATLEARELYATEESIDVLKKVMPMFSGMENDDIIGMTQDAALTTWKDNVNVLKEDAKTIYTSMCDVWTSIGERANSSAVDEIFDVSYMNMLSDKYDSLSAETSVVENYTPVTDENKQQVLNKKELFTKRATITFEVDLAEFKAPEEATSILDEFIETAKILDGAIIQIEGNTEPIKGRDPASDTGAIQLSLERAEKVKQYFIMNGISANRIIVVGNGATKTIVPNTTEENRALNRRTDVFFKLVEQE